MKRSMSLLSALASHLHVPFFYSSYTSSVRWTHDTSCFVFIIIFRSLASLASRPTFFFFYECQADQSWVTDVCCGDEDAFKPGTWMYVGGNRCRLTQLETPCLKLHKQRCYRPSRCFNVDIVIRQFSRHWCDRISLVELRLLLQMCSYHIGFPQGSILGPHIYLPTAHRLHCYADVTYSTGSLHKTHLFQITIWLRWPPDLFVRLIWSSL